MTIDGLRPVATSHSGISAKWALSDPILCGDTLSFIT